MKKLLFVKFLRNRYRNDLSKTKGNKLASEFDITTLPVSPIKLLGQDQKRALHQVSKIHRLQLLQNEHFASFALITPTVINSEYTKNLIP